MLCELMISAATLGAEAAIPGDSLEQSGFSRSISPTKKVTFEVISISIPWENAAMLKG